MEHDKLIWQTPPYDHRSDKDWSIIIEHLVTSVGEYLQQQAVIMSSEVVDNEALFCRIRSASQFCGPLALAWEGRLGIDIIEDKPYVSASIFLFSQRKRLVLTSQSDPILSCYTN